MFIVKINKIWMVFCVIIASYFYILLCFISYRRIYSRFLINLLSFYATCH